MATKSEKILELYAQGLSTRAIAEIVGTSDSYVRVVARQRKGSKQSENDRRYCTSERGRRKRAASNAKYARERYARDEKYRQRVLEAHRQWRARRRAEGVSA